MHIRVVSASSPVARFPTRGICPSHEPLLALQARSHALQFDLGHYPLEKPVEEAGQVSNCALMVKKKKDTDKVEGNNFNFLCFYFPWPHLCPLVTIRAEFKTNLFHPPFYIFPTPTP